MKNSNQHILKTRSIGLIALDNVSRDQVAHVFGNTSKGVFIKTSSKWLVFLSFDQFRGPLTITLENVNPILRQASIGKPIYITSQSLSFPELDITITIQGGEVWQPRLSPTILLKNSDRYENLVCFTKEVISKKNRDGFSEVLPALLGLSNPPPTSRTMIGFDWVELQNLQEYIRNGMVDPLARLLSKALGWGPGLTPSADDFAMGLLLTLNRWQNANWSAGALYDLNHQIVEAAYAKTTSLSANLIECATLGLADERLIDALDYLITGAARKPEIVDHLIRWGNSSGVDALTGMAVTLTAYIDILSFQRIIL